ncbi:MAG TPA: ABC transporter ATP-binding protein [Solirubrobacteraceae bacterium]|jgi:ABC-type polysaccharide/polyol phosphate transport system ATPase subunit|nr:ABC transporter ATP-binding protein [Solirubrobacteraceae bacterium]
MPGMNRGATPPIVVDAVSKTFRVPEERTHTLKERVLHPRRRSKHQSFRALDGISFHVEPGEFFGIAGRNGSGKSTLLKCMAGIYGVDHGRIWVNGRVSTFIELGVGFNPDLAARDNVVLNGIMMGLSPREARARYDAVMDFAELREFEELKLKNYSSGMHVRLAFSVAIQVDAELLLIDEVLAVGDAAFQQKCFDVFNEMRDSGRTIVFVTHDMFSMNRFCHRALLLERGKVVHLGEPQEVGDRYLELNFGRAPENDGADRNTQDGDEEGGDARVLEAWIEDEHGSRETSVPQGQRVTLKALVRFDVDVEDPAASVYVLNENHIAIVVATTSRDHERSGSFRAGDEVLFTFSFLNVLAPGRYNPLFTLARRGTGLDVIDRLEGAVSFVVTAANAMGGLVDLAVEVSVERAASSASLHDGPSEQVSA